MARRAWGWGRLSKEETFELRPASQEDTGVRLLEGVCVKALGQEAWEIKGYAI